MDFDLRNRILGSFQSSIAGGLLLLYALLSDHGINLSDATKTVITMKVLALSVGLWNVIRREGKPLVHGASSPGPSGDGPKTPLFPALILLTTLPLSQVGCYLGGKTTKHKIAIASDNAVTSLDAVTSAVEILKGAGKLSAGAAREVHLTNQKVLEVIDIVRSRAESGYDKKDLLTKISATLKDLADAESRGVAGIGNEQDRARFQDFVWTVRFALETLREIIDTGQEPEIPTEVAKRLTASGSTRGLGGYLADLITLARDTYFALYRETKMAEPVAFEDARVRIAALRTRLIDLAGVSALTPALYRGIDDSPNLVHPVR